MEPVDKAMDDGQQGEGGHFPSYASRAAEIDAAAVEALWSLRGHLIGLMELGLTYSAARQVFRHAVLDLWDLRARRKLSRQRQWSERALSRGYEEGLVLDHAIPAKRLCDIVLAIGPEAARSITPKTKEELASLLNALSVCCVITRVEHAELERRGLKSACVEGKESNPLARYREVNIRIVDGARDMSRLRS